MSGGYGSAIRVFTKVSKIPFSHLRKLDHASVVYMDDSCLQGDVYPTRFQNVCDIITILRELEFVINLEK